jgi:Ca2+-binding EF-hand superfamily protein
MLLQLKADKVKKDLRRVITNNELNLEKIFKKLDKNGNGNLDFDELKVLLKNIDKKLTDNEIMLVFRDFDKDNDGEVDFNEFE